MAPHALPPSPRARHGAGPTLLHSLHQEHSSVLSLAADDFHIYTGSQDGEICIWDKLTFTLKAVWTGHTGSVLALEYASDRQWLFSASGSSSDVWDTRRLSPLYILHPFQETASGDLFSLVWCSQSQTLYFGCQNTSLQWFSFAIPTHVPAYFTSASFESVSSSGASTPTSRKAHKFFDSYPQYTRRPADLGARNPTCCSSSSPPSTGSRTPPDGCIQQESPKTPLAVLHVPQENVIDSAHYGYVYCMAHLPGNHEGSDDPPYPGPGKRRLQLLTGSGDSTVKQWKLADDKFRPSPPELIYSFDCDAGAVLTLVLRGDTVYAGCQDGLVKVWDLETHTLVRTLLVVENADILSMSLLHSDLYVCSANGDIQRWNASFEQTGCWRGHDGIVLSSTFTALLPDAAPEQQEKHFLLVTGGGDDVVKVWDVGAPCCQGQNVADIDYADVSRSINDILVHALTKFVSIPKDCRQAAIWLRKCFTQLGAEASLLPTGDSTNPLVLATFHGTRTASARPRLLFYGHYDVISALPDGWDSDPFALTGKNGYLYGRGATDNKGPIMAIACAAADLLARRALDIDLVLLIEGEEEAGSGGFAETVKRHKEAIGSIDSILVSNSTWIAEDTPCITYGLRGVVHCNVEISNEGPDLHSGVEGGAAREPMLDMSVQMWTSVRPLTEEERQLYKVLSSVTQTPAHLLSARWREPSLTVHNIEVSGPRNSTVISSKVRAHVSLRIVPDQDLATIAASLRQHFADEFKRMKSPNQLKVSIDHTADWWLGNLDDQWFRALEDAVRDEWEVEPLRIREGGSIPSIPYLEKEFACHALHLPLGQSTDQAHLPNERISLSNLRRGKRVVERFLTIAAANACRSSS
ncbi:Zn-dependent exopeptidase [Epithele typhae]|uniref:Zn-dependent exopeptidase n=1 Tax=Epithele typhae TaxID=378194 RepID=UPI002008DC33|nr:Zn-dependent exopeptidase [Epithele typhae]KAH9924603.1 Zn-dependent exopeptidase [Epithele typhae]